MKKYILLLTRTMRLNLLWYIPLFTAVVACFIIPDITSGYHNIVIVFHRFDWFIFCSPAAYLFFSSVLASVLFPVQMMLMILTFFADAQTSLYHRRYLYSFAVVVGIALVCIILQVLIWGSFPLPTDNAGYIHFRMIPFFPWPEPPLFG
jgi:hypothetical protein